LIVKTLDGLELDQLLGDEHASAVHRLIVAAVVIALIAAILVGLFCCASGFHATNLPKKFNQFFRPSADRYRASLPMLHALLPGLLEYPTLSASAPTRGRIDSDGHSAPATTAERLQPFSAHQSADGQQ
jgi:hypothetical protein